MGFLDALQALGKMELRRHGGGEFSDIDSFLQMPADLIEPVSDDGSGKKAKSAKEPAREIRVCLDVINPQADCLEIRGIKKVELVDFWSGNGDEREKKRRYLYRDAVSPSAKWRYSPLYKLGAGVKDARKALIGESDWRSDKSSRFYKLYDSTLHAFEEKGIFSSGGADLIMTQLEGEYINRIAELWTDKKRSYLLIFSPYDNEEERFLYPSEVRSFVKHFRFRLAEFGGTGSKETKTKGKADGSSRLYTCGMCNSRSKSLVNLDKVFAFATFDKKSFLPGLDASSDGQMKMFPLCSDCYQLLSEGRNLADTRFLDTKSIYGVRIWMIPELLFSGEEIPYVSEKSRNFIQRGISNESYLSQDILEQDDSLVYHVVFWQKNQAQERLLLMVEDVPPSRLKHLDTLWVKSITATRLFGINKNIDPGNESVVVSGASSNLGHAMNTIIRCIVSLSGKNDNDSGVLYDRILGVVGRLLDGQPVDTGNIKALAVSRLQGLCADSDWVNRFSGFNMRQLECIVDYLYRVNATLTTVHRR